MKSKMVFLLLGILMSLISLILLMNGVIYQFGVFGTGSGIVLIIWALIGDHSTAKEKPGSISAKRFKVKGAGGFDFVEKVLSGFNEIPADWNSKKDPTKLRERILNLKNMATTKIKYPFGNSLITYLQVSFTKSKDTYMVIIEGEGEESVQVFEDTFKGLIEE